MADTNKVSLAHLKMAMNTIKEYHDQNEANFSLAYDSSAGILKLMHGDQEISSTTILPTTSSPVPCTGITLSANSLSFTTTDTQTITATKQPSNTTDVVTWSVSPTGIVEVDNGTIRPITRGECILTVTCGNQSDTCNIVVDCDINSNMDGYRKVVFDGSENWSAIGWTTYHNAPHGIYELNVSNYISTDMEFPSGNTDNPTFLCSTLEPKTQHQMFNTPQEGIFGTMWHGGNLLGVSTLSAPKGNVNEFKKYLAENNLVVYFKIR